MSTFSFPVIIRRNRQSRRITLSVHGDGRIVVSAPRFVSLRFIKQFIESRSEWISTHMANAKQNQAKRLTPKGPAHEFNRYRARARRFITHKLAELNQHYQFEYRRVAVRNPFSRWGSCSKQGNLNFSYRLLFLPAELANYVVVHELCHLKEFNHSMRFWKLVAETIPDYKKRRLELKKGVPAARLDD